MEETAILYSSLALVLLLISLYLLFGSKSSRKNLPPAPPYLPIIGHFHLLKQPIHRFYQSLSQKYGPVFSLRLGSRLMIVVSSSSTAEECFTKNDIVLANRPKSILAKHLTYNYTMLSNAPYGDHWRNLRRIGAIEIFSSSRLNAFVDARRDEVQRLVLKLSRDSRNGFKKVELKPMFTDLTFNNIMRMVAGKRYYGDEVSNEAEAREFKEVMEQISNINGLPNAADFFPILKWFAKGYEKKVEKLAKRMDMLLQKLIDEQRNKRQENSGNMIDHLLSLQESEPQYYTDEIIKGLILILIVAGTDTAAVTIEWAMSNLLNHPEVLKKAKAEIDSKIGEENLIEEADISKLPYLKSIMDETLRLYPAAPLLIPHMPSTDCTIGGYNVPLGTIVSVNAWVIHRDSNEWDDPTSFKPERFEKEKDESSKLMPFGLGRRACPGAGLARREVRWTLGALIQCFEWERVDGKEIDMAEGEGTIVPKAQPLEAMCKARPIVNKVFY